MNGPGDLGKSTAFSMLPLSPFIKQEPEFTSGSQGSLQHGEPKGNKGRARHHHWAARGGEIRLLG